MLPPELVPEVEPELEPELEMEPELEFEMDQAQFLIGVMGVWQWGLGGC